MEVTWEERAGPLLLNECRVSFQKVKAFQRGWTGYSEPSASELYTYGEERYVCSTPNLKK